MAFLHDLKIIHRDLKPANVLLDENMYPHIADFGFAKFTDTSAQSVSAGTALYQAPEVFKGRVFRFPADVYSYALMFFEIIEGHSWVLGWPTMEDEEFRRHFVDANERPTASMKINAKQKELIGAMWDPDSLKRPTFRDICDRLEQNDFWCAGTDPHEFLKYKAYLDISEQDPSSNPFVSPAWIRQVSQWNELHQILAPLGSNIEEMVVQLLARIIEDTDREQLMKLLRHSFAKANCIRPIYFSDSHFRPLRPHSYLTGNPLLALLVNYSDLKEIEHE
jgi:serine/threonine protein kinase